MGITCLPRGSLLNSQILPWEKEGPRPDRGLGTQLPAFLKGPCPLPAVHGRTGETQGEAQPLHPSFPRAADAIYSWAAVTATQAQRH